MTGGDEPGASRAGMVALSGWTNVGKSTLLNRLVGAKLAAVADVAQTTRHRLMGVRNVARLDQYAWQDQSVATALFQQYRSEVS